LSDTGIARVYARALYEAAAEAGSVQQVGDDLTAFVGALASSSELRAVFLSGEISVEQKKSVVVALLEGADPLVRNFLKVIIDKNREPVVGEACNLFVQRVEAEAGVVKVEMTTAVGVPEPVQEQVRKTLETALEKRVELTVTVDEDIVGGVKLRVGDRIADASIRHRLEQLRARLVSPTARLEGSVEAAS
jgi:F-type H+-transporting ATPase subunit delta